MELLLSISSPLKPKPNPKWAKLHEERNKLLLAKLDEEKYLEIANDIFKPISRFFFAKQKEGVMKNYVTADIIQILTLEIIRIHREVDIDITRGSLRNFLIRCCFNKLKHVCRKIYQESQHPHITLEDMERNNLKWKRKW